MTEPSKIAVIGATGFLGRHLHRVVRERDPSCLGTSRRDDGLATLDLGRPDIRGLALAESGHTHAAITAAVSGVAECEREPERTRAVNLVGTLELVRQLEEEGVAPVLFSSDYVFDGLVGGYPDDALAGANRRVRTPEGVARDGRRETEPSSCGWARSTGPSAATTRCSTRWPQPSPPGGRCARRATRC